MHHVKLFSISQSKNTKVRPCPLMGQGDSVEPFFVQMV